MGIQVSSPQTVVLRRDINALDLLKISIYFQIDYLMRSRRSPFRVTTSYAEHFHFFPVHVKKLDFHDDCVRLTMAWCIRRIRMETALRYGG
jgi:hypothetical protein